MNSKPPLVRQTAWIALIPQLISMGLIAVLLYVLNIRPAVTLAALLYLILSLVLKLTIPISHRRGIKFVKEAKFELAIPHFEKSVIFFTKHEWLDKYRYLTLLSSSRIRYKEMALCNIGFCYSQINNGQKAEAYYELALKEFPESILAKTALNMIKAIKNSA